MNCSSFSVENMRSAGEEGEGDTARWNSRRRFSRRIRVLYIDYKGQTNGQWKDEGIFVLIEGKNFLFVEQRRGAIFSLAVFQRRRGTRAKILGPFKNFRWDKYRRADEMNRNDLIRVIMKKIVSNSIRVENMKNFEEFSMLENEKGELRNWKWNGKDIFLEEKSSRAHNDAGNPSSFWKKTDQNRIISPTKLNEIIII